MKLYIIIESETGEESLECVCTDKQKAIDIAKKMDMFFSHINVYEVNDGEEFTYQNSVYERIKGH